MYSVFGNVAFLMKDVVLLAVSIYLLQEDVSRVVAEEPTLVEGKAAS